MPPWDPGVLMMPFNIIKLVQERQVPLAKMGQFKIPVPEGQPRDPRAKTIFWGYYVNIFQAFSSIQGYLGDVHGYSFIRLKGFIV